MPRLGFAVAAGVAVADQLVKWWLTGVVAGAREGIELAGFLNLVKVENRGISFGMLGGGALPPWLLAAVAGAVAITLGVWLMRA